MDWFEYFKFQKQRDSPSNARSTLLVVAALIATVCFQAGTKPPNGIFDKPKLPNAQTPNCGPPSPPSYVYISATAVSSISVLSAVLGSHATSFLFLFTNSLGLAASTCIIIYLTSGFPFQRELHIALYSMMFTYGFAISAIIKDSDKKEKTIAYVLVTIAFTLPFALRWLPRWGRKFWRPYAGGILSGPMQSLGPQGGLQRINYESDRWHRGTGLQKGLMPYPHMPMPVMRRAEKKDEVGKVSYEEEAKQRQLKAILNKLTPQNFEKLSQQVKQLNIDNVITLCGVISQIFDKALMEPTFSEMYADFCFHLAADLPELSLDNQKITFKRLLLNKCQEEFEKGEREEEEANKAEEEGEVKQSAEEREEKRLHARRRMLGNIRLIGELYRKRMLTERIMHECINKLLGQYQNPDEQNIEALCILMSTIGEMIDHPRAKEHMDAYYDIMSQLSNNMKLSSRLRFMLKDAIDLRKNKWQQRRKVESPKKIEEVHRDAAQEQQSQSRMGRVPSMGNPARRGAPMDFGSRSPSMSPMEIHSSDNRNMSVPLPQRSIGDDSITLGPQGGLARGMAFRGQPSEANVPLAEMPSHGDGRRILPGQNGFNSAYSQSQREGLMPRFMPDRFAAPPMYEQSQSQERNINYGMREVTNPDRASDRSLPTSPPPRGGLPSSTQDMSSDKVWPEEHLHAKSLAAIKEFYSARDEKEVALCIKDLNTPSFYPSMISIWVTDSFERKDMERDLLTKLLVNLTKPQDGVLSQDHLIKGFESVLAVLEDAVNDAPKAAEFLGRTLAKVVLENVVPLSDIGRLIYEGGEEQGRLVEEGLAAEVLGTILDVIKSEKGESGLNEIRSGSNLRLEDFRPAGSNKPSRIDKFI